MLFTRRSYNSLFLVLCVFVSFTLLLLHLEQADARLNLVVVDDGAVVVESDLNPKGSGSFIDFPTSGRSNKLYVPSAASSSNALPLLVMLHGCTQNPDDFATGTRMNDHGEQRGFFVLYPEEPSWANEDECWNWFLPEDQARGGGEPQVIADMVAKVESKYNIDKKRVYVAGLSAGAAMAVIVGVVYPDIFAAVGVCSGLEFEAATSAIEAWTAMVIGGPDPSGQGQVAYQAEGGNARVQGVLVAHGTADITVFPVNGQQVVAQYTTTLDYVLGNGTSNGYITDTPTNTTNGQVPDGHSYTLNEYADSQTGTVLVKYIEVDGMPHAWSGGSSSGTFTDPEGPDVSSILVDWFFSSFPYNATRTFAKEW